MVQISPFYVGWGTFLHVISILLYAFAGGDLGMSMSPLEDFQGVLFRV